MAIGEITARCHTCTGSGKTTTSEGNPSGDCTSCGGTGRVVSLQLDQAFVDKINDMSTKIDALFADLNP